MFAGQAAIDYLAAHAIIDDPCASSHWQKYHSGFKFNGREFEGLQGFGGNGRRLKGLRLLFTRLIQLRFRRFGNAYAKFDAIDALAGKVTSRQGRAYDLDVLRQVLSISFLHSRAPDKLSDTSMFCVIGDGFASMSTLLLASKSAGRVVLVNLTKTLLVDLWYLKLWMGSEKFESCVDLVKDETGLAQALEKDMGGPDGGQRIIAIQACDHELLQKCPIDFVINIASMQEMDPPIVKAYFDDMRAVVRKRELFFYCCNRQEKILPDGVVSRFADYPWCVDDKVLVDGLCPWHQFYYSTLPPYYRPYDGPIMHRLVSLSPFTDE